MTCLRASCKNEIHKGGIVFIYRFSYCTARSRGEKYDKERNALYEMALSNHEDGLTISQSDSEIILSPSAEL
jgi:hypothetical protein